MHPGLRRDDGAGANGEAPSPASGLQPSSPCPSLALPAGNVNLADALLSPAVLRPFIVNWEEVALHFIRGVHADAIADGSVESSSRRMSRSSSSPPLQRWERRKTSPFRRSG
jgi:hypothetical protein